MTMPLRLTVYQGSQLVGEQRFERNIIKLGRLESAHLRLNDAKVSRIHAVIEADVSGQEYSIIDMGSTEGTFLNGDRISKERLRDGDEISLGDTRIVVALDDSKVPSVSDTQVMDAATATHNEASAVVTAAVMATTVPDAAVAYTTPPQAPPSSVRSADIPVALPGHVVSTSSVVPSVSPQRTQWQPPPSNLAGPDVPDTDRALEIRTVWGNTVLDTLTATQQPLVTMGDALRTEGFGPFKRVIRCDIEVHSKNLPDPAFPLAVNQGSEGAQYAVGLAESFSGHLERGDGSVVDVGQLRRGGDAQYAIQGGEVLRLNYGDVALQIRYVPKNAVVAPPLSKSLNFSWLNILLLVFFAHFVAVAAFVTMPEIQSELTEDIFRNSNRFAQFRLTEEEKKRQQNLMLSKLKAGEPGAKAKGKEGKAGREDYKGKKQGRMAVRGDPSEKELAKSTLNKLFGGPGGGARSFLFGSGGLGGELKGALGGVTGAEIGDATGLGGLGARGSGPGGGGLSLDSVGIGALGTKGRGGGQGGYGEGIGGIAKKGDRDISISAGSPLVMGSLDKEVIRRVIQQHIAQIRYCYEKELTRSPGLMGKVSTSFTISGSGSVDEASIVQSTMNNSNVESCITQKIRGWRFPKPKGGGIVVVKYPFVFNTAG